MTDELVFVVVRLPCLGLDVILSQLLGQALPFFTSLMTPPRVWWHHETKEMLEATLPTGLTIVTCNLFRLHVALILPTVPTEDEHVAPDVIFSAYIAPLSRAPCISMASTEPGSEPQVKQPDPEVPLLAACAAVSGPVQQTNLTLMVLVAVCLKLRLEALKTTCMFRLPRFPAITPAQVTRNFPLGETVANKHTRVTPPSPHKHD